MSLSKLTLTAVISGSFETEVRIPRFLKVFDIMQNNSSDLAQFFIVIPDRLGEVNRLKPLPSPSFEEGQGI
jgi:hypothetical protein